MSLDYGNIFDKGMSYQAYRQLIDEKLLNHQTTGPDHSPEMLHYTKMNVQRMNRVEKTIQWEERLLEAVNALPSKRHLLVISEGWCGDAAQIVPVIAGLASRFPEKLELKIVLRDQHLPLIDAHLTNGGRAIPVLIGLDENKALKGNKWGPRPAILQELLIGWRKEYPEMSKVAELLHGWYAKDKTTHTQAELADWFLQEA